MEENIFPWLRKQLTRPDDDIAQFDPLLTCPIVLDLNGDGISYTPLANSNVFFDIDGDKFAERVEWLNKSDGFLVRDLNKNGKIDSVKEMFGENGGTTAFAKLAALDSNRDKVIDAKDAAFSTLSVWRDANGNGAVDSGEMKTLAQWGIKSLSVNVNNITTHNGHAVTGTSTFTRTNGTTGQTVGTLLETNNLDSWYVGDGTAASTKIDLETAFLPLSRGYGTLPSLHYAMTQNATLKTMVKALDALPTSKISEVYNRVDAIVKEWAGATKIAANPDITHMNDQHAAVMSKITDRSTDTFGFRDGVNQTYNMFVSEMLVRLLAQGPLNSVFSNSYYDFTTDHMVLNQSLGSIIAAAKANAPTAAAQKQIYWNEIARVVTDSATELGKTVAALQTQIDAAAGFKTYVITNVGTTGNDALEGNGGVYQGFTGNDFYNTGGKTATVLINSGDGHDRFEGGIRPDVVFGSGITAKTTTYAHDADAFTLKLAGGGSLTLNHAPGWWDNKQNLNVQSFTFADGTKMTMAQVQKAALTSWMTGGNDSIHGFDTNDRITAGNGNDTVYGAEGNDTIIGGKGNDFLSDDFGTNLFIYNLGDGKDTIEGGFWMGDSSTLQFGSGINFENVTFRTLEEGLLLSLPGSGSILLQDNTNIQKVIFGNGVSKTMVELQRLSVIGTAGNDTLYGFNYFSDSIIGGAGNDVIYSDGGDDTLNGGTGNDLMDGSWDNDLFLINKGDGNDTILGGWGNDTIRFGSGVTYGSVLLNTTADGTKILMVSSSQSITLPENDIEQFVFADGTVKTWEQLLSQRQPVNGSAAANTLTGTTYNDRLNGLAGNDTLTGGLGADTLDGGSGIDTASYHVSKAAVTIHMGTNIHSGGDAAGDRFISIENVTGSAYHDVLTGNSGANILLGGAGNDTLSGAGGADRLDGGAGTDTASYTGSANAIAVNLMRTTAQTGGDAAGDILVSIENIIGSTGNDSITGNNGANLLQGGAGNDTLIGGDGNDTLIGGGGSDYMDGGAGFDTLSYATSSTWVSSDLGANNHWNGDAAWDNVRNIEHLIGSRYNDYLTGNAAGNRIDGGQGSDAITGGSGADTLLGDAGNDSLYGGNDNDLLIGGEGSDYIDGGAGIDTVSYAGFSNGVTSNLTTNNHFNGGSHWDSVINVENITGSSYHDSLTGNAASNTLSGGNGNDTLYGMGGADRLLGGAGNDLFVFRTTAESHATTFDTIADFQKGDKIDLRGMGYSSVGAGVASGAKLGYAYDAAAAITTLTAANGLKIALVGKVDLVSADFIFA